MTIFLYLYDFFGRDWFFDLTISFQSLPAMPDPDTETPPYDDLESVEFDVDACNYDPA